MLFSLDANILVYAVDRGDPVKHGRARSLVDRAMLTDCVLALQVIGEAFVASRRQRPELMKTFADQSVECLELFATLPPSPSAVARAINESRHHVHSYWDALLLATLREAGCTVLLSEDMQHGADYDGVRVLNPFLGETLAPEIQTLLITD
jgi:predicted nucleic acid-binding protein